jgi:hypothetical protein
VTQQSLRQASFRAIDDGSFAAAVDSIASNVSPDAAREIRPNL